MPKPDILFILDQKCGVELVVSSGPSMRYPVHTHVASHTIGLVRGGRVRLERGKTRKTLRAGDVFIILPNEPHSLEASRPFAMATLSVETTRPPGWKRGAAAGLDHLSRAGHLTPREADSLKSALRDLPAPAEKTPVDSIDLLRETMQNHPEDERDLADMAAAARIGKYHLIRAFRKRYGLTPRRFLTQNRIRKAKREFLEEPTLTRTALLAGFYDQSHFIREFRRLLGMTPGQYRKARRQL